MEEEEVGRGGKRRIRGNRGKVGLSRWGGLEAGLSKELMAEEKKETQEDRVILEEEIRIRCGRGKELEAEKEREVGSRGGGGGIGFVG